MLAFVFGSRENQMLISELCEELEKVRVRFGDVEVFSGNDVITGLAVLPRAAISNSIAGAVGMIVSILSRSTDRGRAPR
jgi:hypothetical protein